MDFDAKRGLEGDALPFADSWVECRVQNGMPNPRLLSATYVNRSTILDGLEIHDVRGMFSLGAIGYGIGQRQ